MDGERLTREELLELRAALLHKENLRLQAAIAERDWRDLRDRFAAKYGADAGYQMETGAIVRSGVVSQTLPPATPADGVS